MLCPESQLLTRNRAPIRFGGRALAILTALIESAGEIVTKRELFSRVWPDTLVEEGNLKANVAALRRTSNKVGTSVGTGRGRDWKSDEERTAATAS